MNASFWVGAIVSVLGWAILLSGPSLGQGVINIHLLTISQMIIVCGHVVSLVGAILLAAQRISDTLARLPIIRNNVSKEVATQAKIAEDKAASEAAKKAEKIATQRRIFVKTFGEPITDDAPAQK